METWEVIQCKGGKRKDHKNFNANQGELKPARACPSRKGISKHSIRIIMPRVSPNRRKRGSPRPKKRRTSSSPQKPKITQSVAADAGSFDAPSLPLVSTEKTTETTTETTTPPIEEETQGARLPIMTTFDLTFSRGRQLQEKGVKLEPFKPKKFEKIGEFKVEGDLVIGDVDCDSVRSRKDHPGPTDTYSAYQVDDNLLVVRHTGTDFQERERQFEQEFRQWPWTPTGKGVGVDSGRFGFFDGTAVSLLWEIDEMYPSMSNNNMPDFGSTEGIIRLRDADGENIKAILQKKPYLRDHPLGVLVQTGTGDGGFDMYQYGDDVFLLMGEKTADDYVGTKQFNEWIDSKMEKAATTLKSANCMS